MWSWKFSVLNRTQVVLQQCECATLPVDFYVRRNSCHVPGKLSTAFKLGTEYVRLPLIGILQFVNTVKTAVVLPKNSPKR